MVVYANSVIIFNSPLPVNVITTSDIICGSSLKLGKIDLGEFLSTSSILTIMI